MERLTIRNSDGSVSQPLDLRWAEALEKLAAYEDTGLTPENIRAFCTPDAYEVAKLILELIETGGGYHLQELLKAGSEGRLIVLKCRIGDTVWVNYEGKPHKMRVQGISVSVSGRDTFLHFGGYPIASAWGSDIGKTVFLTREEAEAALKGGGNNGTDG